MLKTIFNLWLFTFLLFLFLFPAADLQAQDSTRPLRSEIYRKRKEFNFQFLCLKKALEHPNPDEVYEIYIQGQYCTDETEGFPIEVIRFKNLKTLIFSHGITINYLPKEIEQLEKLEVLILEGCSLKEVAPHIGALKNLKVLHLSFTSINELPPEILQLKNLRYLNLLFTRFEAFPTLLEKMENLEVVDFHGKSCATVPPELKKKGAKPWVRCD